jgi:SAM-dependent methyltransferase
MSPADTSKITAYHQARIAEYGLRSSMALGWNTVASQRIRFDVLAGIGEMSNHSVLDAGCGRGDLRVHLGLRYPGITYTGIDQMEPFIRLAQKQYGHIPRTTFLTGNIENDQLPPCDYVLCSGALNYKNVNPRFIYQIIKKLFDTSKLGLGFNLLSKTGYPPGDLSAYNPELMMDYCRTLSKKVKLIEGYQEGDYTIYMYQTEKQKEKEKEKQEQEK